MHINDRSLHDFWNITWKVFKELNDIAATKVIFPTSNLCEQIFSTYIFRNGKKGGINLEHYLSIAITFT